MLEASTRRCSAVREGILRCALLERVAVPRWSRAGQGRPASAGLPARRHETARRRLADRRRRARTETPDGGRNLTHAFNTRPRRYRARRCARRNSTLWVAQQGLLAAAAAGCCCCCCCCYYYCWYCYCYYCCCCCCYCCYCAESIATAGASSGHVYTLGARQTETTAAADADRVPSRPP